LIKQIYLKRSGDLSVRIKSDAENFENDMPHGSACDVKLENWTGFKIEINFDGHY
jgi:hypothetical protein